jgi:UPF0271 protein
MPVDFVDINCDMGEGFGVWRLGDTDDSKLFELISSANIATGFHAGDPTLMDRSVRLAVEHGVGIGAHPSYRDLHGFGRRKIDGNVEELVNDIVYQVGSLREFARRYNAVLQHVKPHGALYMELAANEEMSASFVDYMHAAEPQAAIFCMGVSATYRIAKAAGHPVVREFYADRDYDDSGSIVFTRHVGHLDPDAIARKVVLACKEGIVRTVNGGETGIEFESICFHSDTPGSERIAATMREALRRNGIQVRPVSEILRS